MLQTLRTRGRATLAIIAAGAVLFSFAWVFSRPWRSRQLKAGQTQLTVLHWGDKTEDDIVRGLIGEFEKQNPDVRVARINVGSNAQLQTKLQTMLAAGQPADLFYLDFPKVAAFASHDVLEEIEPWIERDRSAGVADVPNLDDFFPSTLNALRYDPHRCSVGAGPLVGLPKDFTSVGFYYNKRLFDQAGVPYPPKDSWTWDQFIAAARRIGQIEGCYGAEVVTWESWVRMFLFSHGLDVADPGFQKFHLTDPKVVAVLDKLRSWFHDEERTLLSAKTQLETGQEPFLTGRIGMVGPYGRWKVPMYRLIADEKFDWDFAPLPHAPDAAPANGVVTVGWAMAKASQHKAESWRLMKFLLSRRGQEIVCQTGLAVPVLQSIANSPCFADPNSKPESDAVFLSEARVARPIEWPPDPRFMDELKIAFENIFKLNRPTQPELARVQDTWETIARYNASAPPMPWNQIATVISIVVVCLLGLAFIVLFRNRSGRLAAQEEIAGFGMVSPWLIGFAVFCAFPIVMSLLLGFTRWNPMEPVTAAEWVGFDNFRELLTFDPTFRTAVWVTTWYALLAVPSSQIFALYAALLMNHEFRGIGTFRAIWYLPSVLAGVGMAILWKWVFHHEHGLLNAGLAPICESINPAWKGIAEFWNSAAFQANEFGDWVFAWLPDRIQIWIPGLPLAPTVLTPPHWLEKDAESWGVPAFALINLWLIGGTMMIYLAGLKGISREMYEAADIDGASKWRKFTTVTLPMLSPVIFFNTIMAIIASFQIFTQVFVMTGGGPGTATHFYVYYLFKKAFDLGAMGYASAMAWILLLIVLGLTLLVMRGTRRFVYYEALK